jgi:hypothetical protein
MVYFLKSQSISWAVATSEENRKASSPLPQSKPEKLRLIEEFYKVSE